MAKNMSVYSQYSDKQYLDIFHSISIRNGQYHFDDITEYLIFLSVGGLRATVSTDSSLQSVFGSPLESDSSTLEEFPQN